MPKYRVSVLVEKETKRGWEIIKENATSFDDFSSSEKMYVLLVETESKILSERERLQNEQKNQDSLFKK